MKIFFIFFTLFLSINSIPIFRIRNAIEGFLKILSNNDSFEFGDQCITQNFDQILNDISSFAYEYYYSIKQEDKSKFLINIIFKIVEMKNEISNCTITSFDYESLLIIFVIADFLKTDAFLNQCWEKIVEIENKLIEAYNSKEYNDSDFGKVLANFIIELIEIFKSPQLCQEKNV